MRVTLILLVAVIPSVVSAFCFDEAAREEGLSADLLRSIARVESGNNPAAVNRNGNGSIDLGLMQVNSSWVKTLSLDEQELVGNPCYNVRVGAKIFKKCVDRHGYTWEAVGCYHAMRSDARVKYSWRIFGDMLRNGKAHPTDSYPPPRRSSLLFTVRDIQEKRR